MEFFDSHAHYNDERFEEDRDELIKRIYNEGIGKIINVGYSLESSKEAIKIAEDYEFMYATAGISPNDIDNFKKEELLEIENLAKNKKVVAIGEIGLDYYWNKENKELQRQVFKAQIEIANRLDLPIVIHTRESIYDTLDILKKYGTKAIITEFASLLGGSTTVESQFIEGDSINAKTGCWWTKSHYTKFEMVTIGCSGYFLPTYVEERRHGGRPAVTYSSISNLVSNIKRGKNGILEVEYGEYPQNIVGEDFSEFLERMYLNKTLKETGKKYTTDSIPHYAYNTPFKERNHIEYEYRKRKYIRIIGDYNCDGHVLFDGRVVEPNKPYFVLYPPPLTELVKISSKPQTTFAPFSLKIRLVLCLV